MQAKAIQCGKMHRSLVRSNDQQWDCISECKAVHLRRDVRFMSSCIIVGLVAVELLPLLPSINNFIKQLHPL